MHTRSGLDILLEDFPRELRGASVGVLCHAPSITSSYEHIVDALTRRKECKVAAIFGPQHGLSGQTQDNMIEWEGETHPRLGIPVYSLYGRVRRPTPSMLGGLDALVVDLQDVGARPYTYVWTLKECLAACAEQGIAVWVLDRPNPVAALGFDGPMLTKENFTFVGGAEIPLCHRLTVGELAWLLRGEYAPGARLRVVWMEGWWRDSLWSETGLPWVMPSPNMPTPDTALVYPGMVLLEATNLSEGRGTTRPFELWGAPFLDPEAVLRRFRSWRAEGCLLREHGFIPTFQKWGGSLCRGFQIHVTEPRRFAPVTAALALVSAAAATAGERFSFNPPPYEYETRKMPFDVLSGDSSLRRRIESGRLDPTVPGEWREGHERFARLFRDIAHYPERPA